MNAEQIKGNWKQLTGQVKQKWGKLTDDDLDVAAGHREQLAGLIQERYGVVKEEAEIPADPHVVFRPEGVNIYADSWRVGREA